MHKYALALLATKAVAQLIAAPIPSYPDSMDGFKKIQVGTADSFDFLINFAGWSIIDDRGNSDLENWFNSYENFGMQDELWEDLKSALPNGYAMIGCFTFTSDPNPGDFFIAGLVPVEIDILAWAAYFEAGL